MVAVRIYENSDGHVALARLRDVWSLGPVASGMYGRAGAHAAALARDADWPNKRFGTERIPSIAGWVLIAIYDDRLGVLNVFTDTATGEAGRLYLLGDEIDLATTDDLDWTDD